MAGDTAAQPQVLPGVDLAVQAPTTVLNFVVRLVCAAGGESMPEGEILAT